MIKCYQAAADAFTELIAELAAGTVAEIKQNLADRTLVSCVIFIAVAIWRFNRQEF